MGKKITVEIPDQADLVSEDLRMILAAQLYEQGVLSLSQAAEFCGMTSRLFAEQLGKVGVNYFNYPASDIATDIRNAGGDHIRR